MVSRLKRPALPIAALALGLSLEFAFHQPRPASPPIFDGLPLPTAPYNYVSPPPSLRSSNKPAQGGQAVFPVLNGQAATGGIQTGDAQVLVFFGPGALKIQPGTLTVTVRIEPLKHPPAPPSGDQIVGNVYQVSATQQPGGAPTSLVPGHQYRVTMRYPAGPFSNLQLYAGGSWQSLATVRDPSGNTYAGATLDSLGDIAATAPQGASGPGLLSNLGRYAAGFGLLAFVILFGIIALVQEVRRRARSS
jgi:hypothetical protein